MVSLTVAATNNPVGYQWYTTNNNIFTPSTDDASHSGATTATLSFLNVTTNDAANYVVVVTNNSGSVTSSVATLTVNASAPANQLTPFAGTSFEIGDRNSLNTEYCYQYAGSDAGNANSITGGTYSHSTLNYVGVTNSLGWQFTFDTASLATDPNYAGAHAYTYWAGDMVMDLFPTAIIPASSNLTTYVLSFDAQVQGLTNGYTNITLKVTQLQMNLSNSVLINLTYNTGVQVNTNYTHFNIPFSSMTVAGGNVTNLANSVTMTNMSLSGDIAMTFETTSISAFGLSGSGDSGHEIDIDNLYLSSTTASALPPLVESPILAQCNFDNFSIAPDGFEQGDFSYFYSGGPSVPGLSVTDPVVSNGGVGGSNALEIVADGTAFSSQTPGYSGFGGGVWIPLSGQLTTTDLSMYRLHFNARAAGLPAGMNQIPCVVFVHFLGPDGTTGPADGNSDLILALDTASFNVTSNFQATSWTFSLKDMTVDTGAGGSLALFAQYYTNVTKVVVELQNSDFYDDFQHAPGDVLALDDIELVGLTPGLPPLSVARVGGQTQIAWTAAGTGVTTLQGAANVQGPYNVITGASNPYTVPTGSTNKFFRAMWTSQ